VSSKTFDFQKLCKKNELIALIRKVDKKWGGDDPVWLNEYIDEVITLWSHDLDKAILQFKELQKQKVFNHD
jgi:hypothetical protein